MNPRKGWRVTRTFFKLGVILTLVLLLLSLVSCSANVEKVANKYSREHVKSVCSNTGFGKGIEDDAYVALDYIYTSDNLRAKYGELFQVNDFGGTAEWGFRLGSIYKATARYVATIDSDHWIVELSKNYFGKWAVEKCYIEEN